MSSRKKLFPVELNLVDHQIVLHHVVKMKVAKHFKQLCSLETLEKVTKLLKVFFAFSIPSFKQSQMNKKRLILKSRVKIVKFSKDFV